VGNNRPDVDIIYKGRRIWFEATSPTCGAPDSLDYIALPAPGQVYDVPQEKIILRYLNSISEKYECQYANWLKKGIVSDKDAFVIALNPREIPFDHADTVPPRILQAGYTVRAPYIVIDRQTAKAVTPAIISAKPLRRHRAQKLRPACSSARTTRD